MFKKGWASISNTGLSDLITPSDAKRIKLTNRLGIIAVFFTLPYIIGFFYFGFNNIGLLLCFFSSIYISVVFFNSLKLYNVAKLVLYITVLIHQFIIASVFGEKAEVHLIYIALILLPIVLYNYKKETVWIVFYSSITVLAILLLYFTNFSLFSEHVSEQVIKTLNIAYKITTMAGVIVILYASIMVSEKTERILDTDNLFLQFQLKAIFDNSHDAIFLVDIEKKEIKKVNKRAVELFEMGSEDKIIGMYGLDFHKVKATESELQEIRLSLIKTGSYEGEILYKTGKGNEFWGAIAIKQMAIDSKKYQVVRITDSTIQHEINAKLKSSLHEKEILLAEIHHRVKNNMAVISGLLGLQSTYVENEQAKALFEESRNRIHSMALIHDKLYQHETFAKIDFCAYINDLVNHIKESYNPTTSEIKFSITCNEIFLDIKYAVPCGLILNELISNAYKHAFRGKEKGEIKIVSTKMGEKFTMMVSDNGVGCDMEKELLQPRSLGLTLVNGLVDQINGTLKTTCNNGTAFYISFEV
jgi:PAS domain S-box-containing protein